MIIFKCYRCRMLLSDLWLCIIPSTEKPRKPWRLPGLLSLVGRSTTLWLARGTDNLDNATTSLAIPVELFRWLSEIRGDNWTTRRLTFPGRCVNPSCLYIKLNSIRTQIIVCVGWVIRLLWTPSSVFFSDNIQSRISINCDPPSCFQHTK